MLRSTQPTPINHKSNQQRIRSGSIALQDDCSINLPEKYPTVNPIYAYTDANIKQVLDAYLVKRNLTQQPVTGIILSSNSALKTANGSTFSFADFESVQVNSEQNESHNFENLSKMIGKLIELNHHGFFEIVSKHVILVPFTIKKDHISLAVISFEIKKLSDVFYLGSNINIKIDDPTHEEKNYLPIIQQKIFNSLFKHTKDIDLIDGQGFTVNIIAASCKKINHYRDCGVVVVSRMIEFLDHLELSQEFQSGKYSIGDLYQLRNRHLVTAPEFTLLQQEGKPAPDTITTMFSAPSLSTIEELDSKGRAIYTEDETGNMFDGLVLNSLAVATGRELVNGSEYTGQFKDGRRIGMGLEKNSEQASGFGVYTSFNGLRDAETIYLTGEICAIVDVDTTSIDIRKMQQINCERGFKVLYKGNIKNGVIDGAGTISIVGYKASSETEHLLNNQILSVDVCTAKFSDGKIIFEHMPRISTQDTHIVNLILPDNIDNYKHKFLLHATPDFYVHAFNTRNELIQFKLGRSRSNSLQVSSLGLTSSQQSIDDSEFKRARIEHSKSIEESAQDNIAHFLPLLEIHVASQRNEQEDSISTDHQSIFDPVLPSNKSPSL